MKIIVSYACVVCYNHNIHNFYTQVKCTTTFNFIFIDCESETPIGEKQRAGDIPNGGQVDITCSGGCIHFVEVIFNKCTIPY